MNTRMPSEHADALKAMMRYDTDPRWHDKPISPPPPEKQRRLMWWVVVPSVVVGLVIGCWAALAAERDRPHDLWLLVKPTTEDVSLAATQRNNFKIGAGYVDKRACEKVKDQMRKVAGTLQCLGSDR